MQLSSTPSSNSQNVTQTATTVAQGVSHNQQQNIVMVRYLLDQIENCSKVPILKLYNVYMIYNFMLIDCNFFYNISLIKMKS